MADDVLILAGTILLAVGAYILNPAGPWLVTGAVCLMLGLALGIQKVKGRR